MNVLLQDVRHAARALRRSAGFTVLALVCLALGIGATTTVFSAVNTLLLRPLPFAEPDRLMLLHTTTAPAPTLDNLENFSWPEYMDWSAEAQLFAGTAAFANYTVNLGGVDEPERLKASRVTASLFPLLGVEPVLGRNLTSAEELAGGVVVLGWGVWQRRFAGARDVIGRTVTVNGAPHTVVGVMPRGFRFPETSDVWLPAQPAEAADSRIWRQYDVLARLAPGITLDLARERVSAVAARLARAHPEANGERGGWIQPYREMFSRQVRPIMLIMLGAVGFVLLIACANVANLLLARATSRQREVSILMALGASRGRIIRQLITESVMLGLAGGVLGAILGSWGIDAIARTLPTEDLPFWMVFSVDLRVLVFTFAVATLCGMLFGLAPALETTNFALVAVLKRAGARGVTAGGGARRMRNVLVVAQMTLSLVLLAGAMLMVRSFLQLQNADPGFQAAGVITFETSLQGDRYAEPSAVRTTYGSILEAIAALPGVTHAAAVSQLPVASCCSHAIYHPEGSDLPPSRAAAALYSAVTPGFFATLLIPVLAGRVFDESDAANAQRTAVVNAAFAERTWPGENVIGRRFRLDPRDSTWLTIVGVVGNVKQRELAERDRPHIYVPHAQVGWRTLTIVARSSGPAAASAVAVREALREVDSDLPAARLLTMEEVVSRRMFQPRVYGGMFAVFAVAALLLASVGLYGVIAYSVAQRTQEIGVRMALGAHASLILRMVLGEGARLLAIGLGLGLPAAFGLAKLLRGTLYGVAPSDPLTFISIPVLLTTVALLATAVPARRAARTHPMEALRAD